jgi:hypothetical protein
VCAGTNALTLKSCEHCGTDFTPHRSTGGFANPPVAALLAMHATLFPSAQGSVPWSSALSGGNSESAAVLSFVNAANGNLADARRILVGLEGRSRHEYVPSFNLAIAYTGLGDKTRALTYLQKAYNERCDLVPTLKVSPLFDSLHSDPRFQKLLQQIGFPA